MNWPDCLPFFYPNTIFGDFILWCCGRPSKKPPYPQSKKHRDEKDVQCEYRGQNTYRQTEHQYPKPEQLLIFLLHFNIAESLFRVRCFVGNCRNILYRSQFHCFHTSSAEVPPITKSNVIRRTSCCTQCFHFFGQEFLQRNRIQQRFCFLKQIRFIGRSTTFGTKEIYIRCHDKPLSICAEG